MLIVACLVVPIAAALKQRAPNRTEAPLVGGAPEWTSEAIPVPGSSYVGLRGWTSVHRITLSTSDVGRLVGHQEIALLVATYDTGPLLERAELIFTGTACTYRTSRDVEFPNNALLMFYRGEQCSPLRGQPDGRVELIVRLHNTAKLALWTLVAATEAAPPGTLQIHRPDPSTPVHFVRGKLLDTFEAGSTARISLLAYVWQVAGTSTWIWCVVAISTVLLFFGTLFFWEERGTRTRSGEAAVRAAATFCLTAGVGLLYAVCTPPFQAADEPNHFVGFINATERRVLGNDATTLASLGHFERIQFHPEERFRTSDLGNPGVPWNDGTEPEAAVRGGGVRLMWRAVAPVLRSLQVPRLLFALRVLNVLLFALTAAAMAAVLVTCARVRQPQLLLFPLLLVPAIPFFGMHVSNHATLLCAYLVMATGVVLLVLDAPAPAVAGLAIGAGWGVGLAISRSALPLAPFLGVLLAARLFLGRGGRTAFRFWAGFTVPLCGVLAVLDRQYLDTLAHFGAQVLPRPMARASEVAARFPVVLVAFGIAAAAIEVVIARSAHALGVRRWVAKNVRPWVTVAAAATVAAVLLGSWFVRLPTLPSVDRVPRLTSDEYAWRATSAGLTILRLRYHDRLTSTTFWTGFGWLETLPPPAVVSILATLTAIGLCGLLVRTGRSRDTRRVLWLGAAGLGYAGSLAAYALIVLLTTPADLHGRYLLGLYLSMLVLCWIPLSEVGASWSGSPAVRYRALAGGLAGALVNGYCLRFIAERYF